MADVITCNVCGSDGPFCGSPEYRTPEAIWCPRRLMHFNRAYPLGIFSPLEIGLPENPNDPTNPFAVRNPDIIFYHLRACMDYVAGGSVGPDPTKLPGYSNFAAMSPLEQRVWHASVTKTQPLPGYIQPQRHGHVAENHASDHNQIPEHADDIPDDGTISNPNVPDDQRSGYFEASENDPASGSNALNGELFGSDSSDEDFSPDSDTSDDSQASDSEDASEDEELRDSEAEGNGVPGANETQSGGDDKTNQISSEPVGIELDQFDRELLDSTDYSEDDESVPVGIEIDQFEKGAHDSTDSEDDESDHSEDPRPETASTENVAMPSVFASDCKLHLSSPHKYTNGSQTTPGVPLVFLQRKFQWVVSQQLMPLVSLPLVNPPHANRCQNYVVRHTDQSTSYQTMTRPTMNRISLKLNANLDRPLESGVAASRDVPRITVVTSMAIRTMSRMICQRLRRPNSRESVAMERRCPIATDLPVKRRCRAVIGLPVKRPYLATIVLPVKRPCRAAMEPSVKRPYLVAKDLWAERLSQKLTLYPTTRSHRSQRSPQLERRPCLQRMPPSKQNAHGTT
jgi:hypothetical protein